MLPSGTVKPQPDIYTVMLIAAILVLAIGIGVAVYSLMAAPAEHSGGYGLKIGDFFAPIKEIISAK
jgi:hypothetical protein